MKRNKDERSDCMHRFQSEDQFLFRGWCVITDAFHLGTEFLVCFPRNFTLEGNSTHLSVPFTDTLLNQFRGSRKYGIVKAKPVEIDIRWDRRCDNDNCVCGSASAKSNG